MEPQPHIIRRQVLEVEISGTEADGFALQRRLPHLCQDWLITSLEGVFDRLVPADEHWTIDRLDINVGSLPSEAFERGIIDAVTQAVERYLKEHAPVSDSSVLRRPAAGRNVAQGQAAIDRNSSGQSLRDAFLHFLHTGVLPWWLHLPHGKTFEGVVRWVWDAGARDGGPDHFAAALVDALGSATVRARLVRQFSAEFLDTLLCAFNPHHGTVVREVLEELQTEIAAHAWKRASEQVWQTAFLKAALGERLTPDTLAAESLRTSPVDPEWQRALPSRFTNHKTPAAGRDPHSAKNVSRAAPRLDLDEGVYVNHAGIVLLHPFFPQFFEALGIARDGMLLQPERALCLMHFLATGQRVAPEYDLLLPKVLCNVPPETTVDARIELTAAEEEEAAALLASVIGHWDALGDTSIDGLRGTFLARPGKLSRRGDDDVLQVEARAVDVLLDQMPWGIGMIQLPWMTKLLWVEWRF